MTDTIAEKANEPNLLDFHPLPWRASEKDGRDFVFDCNGMKIAYVWSTEIAQGIVALANKIQSHPTPTRELAETIVRMFPAPRDEEAVLKVESYLARHRAVLNTSTSDGKVGKG